jgi:bifunctional non-homologous end joining protein LigD
MAADPPTDLLVAGDPIDQSVSWVRPEIVIDVRFTAWSGAGRVRHPVYLSVRERPAREVVMEAADPDALRRVFTPRRKA